MRGVIIVSKFWTRFFSFGHARAITLFPFVFIRSHNDRLDPLLVNHERIHLQQAIETLVIPFYLFYTVEFLIRFLQYRDFNRAYISISFEKEAYQNQGDLDYLTRRTFWAFTLFLRS